MKSANSINNSKTHTSLSDKIFILAVYILFISSGISYLKIGGDGINITQDGGKPFVYEISIIFFLLAFFLYLLKNKLVINKEKKKVLILMALIYFPVFFIHLIFAEDILYGYFGLGQLRLLLSLNILFFISVFYPINQKILKHTFIAIIIIGFVNCSYAILTQFQIVDVLYNFTPRFSGLSRSSGLLSVPASLGTLAATNIVLGFWLYKEKKKKVGLFIILLNAIGMFLSASNTSFISIACVTFILYRKYFRRVFSSKFLFIALSSGFFVAVIYNINLIFSQNTLRINSINGAIKLWTNSYTLGIPWGEVVKYSNDFGFQMIVPHNWLLISLVHGGTISFIALCGLYIYYFKRVSLFIKQKSDNFTYNEVLLLVVFLLLIAALFEQIHLLAPVVFILYVFIGFSTQLFEK